MNMVIQLDICNHVFMFMLIKFMYKKDGVHEEIFCCNEGIWSEISI